MLNLAESPLATLPQEVTRPAKGTLEKIMEEYR